MWGVGARVLIRDKDPKKKNKDGHVQKETDHGRPNSVPLSHTWGPRQSQIGATQMGFLLKSKEKERGTETGEIRWRGLSVTCTQESYF